jgi:alpha-1,2-mannosyltransferase
VTMVALGPLALLSATAAYRVFVVLSVAALLAGLAWTGQSVQMSAGPAVLATGVLVVSPAAVDTLAQGQIYPLLGLGLVAAWVLGRQGRGRASGIALGLVVAFKPVFVAILLWPLLRRRHDVFVAALLAAAAATVVGVVVAGPAATLRYVAVLGAGFPHEDLYNASLLTTGLRLFTPGRDVPPVLDVPVLGWVVALAAVAVLAITLLRSRRTTTDLWAITAACLVASPLSWRGYLVVLFPGVLLLLAHPRARTLAVTLLAALSVPFTAPALFAAGTPLAVVATLLLPATLVALWAALYGAGEEDDDAAILHGPVSRPVTAG